MTGATTKRDLRTGRSLWADSSGLGVRTRPLTEAIAVDVAVVGAGISGPSWPTSWPAIIRWRCWTGDRR
jgi:hypothetical protein